MLFQKILCIAMLIVATITFIYALGVMTDVYDGLFWTITDPEDPELDMVEGARIYIDMQHFNDTLVGLTIGFILVALTLFVTLSNSRRKYYISNYVATIATVVYGIALSAWAMGQIGYYKAEYLKVNMEQLELYAKIFQRPVIHNTRWFTAGYAVFAIVIVFSLILVANLVWKILLMKKESQLLSNNKEGVTA